MHLAERNASLQKLQITKFLDVLIMRQLARHDDKQRPLNQIGRAVMQITIKYFITTIPLIKAI